jgi:DNA processing protein
MEGQGRRSPGASVRLSATCENLERTFDREVCRSVSHAHRGNYSGHVYTSSPEERAALVTLLRARPEAKTWPELTAEVLEYGSAQLALEALQPPQLFISDEQRAALTAALADVEAWDAEGIEFITILDDRYPSSVRDIHQAPPFLFTRGQLRANDIGVSVVGSRDASPDGLQMAADVARALVDLDVSVISGLAAGIDSAAHAAALEAAGRPVGVIGTGIRRQYPAANRDLHYAVAERGLLISQFWPDAPPQKHTFLMRNATMSGYGVATVVAEAGEYSGARAQARMAVEHGRPVILAERVVERTEWAKALVGRPGVDVAATASDVVRIVRHLLETPAKLDAALERLTAV